MFKELELIRQYCIGGLAPIGYDELDKGTYMDGYKAAMQNVKAYIEKAQERIVADGMASWEVERLRSEGAYDKGRDGWA